MLFRSDVAVDKVWRLDQSGELPAERTKGGHRRFSRKALDAYLARKGRGGSPRVQERPRRPSRPVERPEPIADPLEEDPEDFEPGDENYEPFVESAVPASVTDQSAGGVHPRDGGAEET